MVNDEHDRSATGPAEVHRLLDALAQRADVLRLETGQPEPRDGVAGTADRSNLRSILQEQAQPGPGGQRLGAHILEDRHGMIELIVGDDRQGGASGASRRRREGDGATGMRGRGELDPVPSQQGLDTVGRSQVEELADGLAPRRCDQRDLDLGLQNALEQRLVGGEEHLAFEGREPTGFSAGGRCSHGRKSPLREPDSVAGIPRSLPMPASGLEDLGFRS